MSSEMGVATVAQTITDLHAAARWYAEHGIPVFPLQPREKRPLTQHGFQDASTDLAQIDEWWERWPDANIGMPTAGKLVVDIDPRNGGPADRDEIVQRYGTWPETAEQSTGGGGRHIVFNTDDKRKPAGKLREGADIKSAGGYIVVAPSIHPSGARYEWDGLKGAKALLCLADAPDWAYGEQQHNTPYVLPKVIPHGQQHNTLVSLAGSMRRRGANADAIYAALVEINKSCEMPGPEKNLRKIADSFMQYPPNPQAKPGSGVDILSRDVDLLRLPLNDYGNGQRVIAIHGADMRYCHAFRSWLVYDGTRWVADCNGSARKRAQETMLEFAKQAMNCGDDAYAKFAGRCLDSNRLTGALREAEPHLPVSVDDLDTHRDLLNCANGTIDLRTGELRPHERQDMITKVVSRNYLPQAQCPTWKAFVSQVLPGLGDYLQRAIGYSLTGHTSEKAVFICHGSGNNGKSTLLSTVREVIGESYATLLQIDTLMARAADNNSQSDLADLRGTRFAMTSETEEGQRLAEGRLKRITQGMGKIKAVRKYENPFEFYESHKLWIDGNHKPTVRGTDQAIWNRLRLLPFVVKISDSDIDRELPDKLMREAEGILSWAVAGAAKWYRERLGQPVEIQTATQEWREASDYLGRFIAERCITGDAFRAPAAALYGEYKRWAESGGEHALTSTAFGLRLAEREIQKKKTERGLVYLGIGLLTEAPAGF